MENNKLNSVLEGQVLEIQTAMEEERQLYASYKNIISRAISPIKASDQIDFNPEGTLLHNYFDYSIPDPNGGVYCLFYFKQIGITQKEDLSITHLDFDTNEYFKVNIQTEKLTGGRYKSSINTNLKRKNKEFKNNSNINLAIAAVDSFIDAFNLANE